MSVVMLVYSVIYRIVFYNHNSDYNTYETFFQIFNIFQLELYNLYGSTSVALNMTLLVLCGLLVNGPYALITTAVSAELGTHHSLKGNGKAVATVTAIIDGTGSIGELSLKLSLLQLFSFIYACVNITILQRLVKFALNLNKQLIWSTGAAVGPLLAGVVSGYGWVNVFYMLMASDVCALVVRSYLFSSIFH